MPRHPKDRPLNHELSTQYYQPNTLEKALWFRVATRDYTELLNAFNFRTLFSRFERTVELLDVGCGTGKFPSMLRSHLPSLLQVDYDYLDPSQHSLAELRTNLMAPFMPRHAYHTTLETFEPLTSGYQIIWCLQSLYCVQYEYVQTIMATLHKLLDPRDGLVLIYLASGDAFYHRLYNTYNREVYPNLRKPYITAENITQALTTLNIYFEVKKLDFFHTIDCTEQRVVQNYINQCVFDSQGWGNAWQNESIQTLLESHRNGNAYQFPQQVWLIVFGKTAEITNACWVGAGA